MNYGTVKFNRKITEKYDQLDKLQSVIVNLWLIIAVTHTTKAVVKLKPGKNYIFLRSSNI